MSSFAETAADFANRGAQKYIFGQDDAAEAEISTGLTKFPNDRELNQIAELLRKKPKQQQKSQDQQQEQQDQQSQSGGDDQQKPDKNKEGNENKEQKPGGTPTPSPGNDQQDQPGSSPSPSADKGSGGDKEDASPSPSQSPSDGGEQSPSPSPGEGEGEQQDGSPSPSPGSSPQKLTGEVKGADGDKPNEPPQSGELVQAEPETDGQMSEKQAQMLLQSMKDEERRVQLDERKATRRVYKDW